jgi:thioredoxin reductase (NADPH)
VPGEDLPKVSHYYDEPHPYFGRDVIVVGGKNSAAIAALDLYRHGARVTLVHRGAELHRHIKYWIKPDIENRIKRGEIAAYFNTTIERIELDDVILKTPLGHKTLPNHQVFALTGYRPDFTFIESLGIKLDEKNSRCPICNRQTLESNVPGLYVAGVVVAGERTNEIFIENGRFHGRQIAEDLKAKIGAQAPSASAVDR